MSNIRQLHTMSTKSSQVPQTILFAANHRHHITTISKGATPHTLKAHTRKLWEDMCQIALQCVMQLFVRNWICLTEA